METERKRRKRPWPVSALIGFFSFGLAMCLLTMILLLFPGSSLDVLWKLKPETQRALAAHPFWAIALMLVVACACGGAAVGLARCAEWGRRVAIGVLVANLIGDTLNAFVRSNWRTLVGLPIGGLLIFYLLRARTARHFRG